MRMPNDIRTGGNRPELPGDLARYNRSSRSGGPVSGRQAADLAGWRKFPVFLLFGACAASLEIGELESGLYRISA
jgi:hypothetical protein